MLYAVIMAGGSGTRLWPLSRKNFPKQALKLIGERTMFQHAVDRLAPLFPPERIVVVTNAALADALRDQVPDVPADNFIIEPAGRNSAPAAGLAAAYLLHTDPDATMVMLTADHFIVDTVQFRSALEAAAAVAADGSIVTLGIRPAHPSTGYGYIRLGEEHGASNGLQVYASAGFVEKPDAERAAQFVGSGRYVWNSGMFVWRADRLMAEFAAQLPALHAPLVQIGAALGMPHADEKLAAAWQTVPNISIDYGIMEKAERVFVIPVDIGWSDIGSWASLLDVLPGDDQDNVVVGPGLALDSRGNLLRSDGRLVALIGLDDVIVVDTPDVVLVCAKDRAEAVRDVVRRLESEGKDRYL
jgi:mannose-1-phosphate guanylyltransferase